MEERRTQTPPAMPRPLPGRRHSIKVNSIEELIDPKIPLEDMIFGSLYVKNIEIFADNIDVIKYRLDRKKADDIGFCSSDYEVLRYINMNLPVDNRKIDLRLIDDFELKDRTYINPDEFEKMNLVIPMNYVMWGKNMTKDQKISFLNNNNSNLAPTGSNGINYVHVETIKKIKEIIAKLGEECEGLTDLEKIIVISNYIQSRTQFTDKNGITHADHVYIIDPKDAIVDNFAVSSGENVILNKYGLCCGFALATQLLLNNPTLKININSINGSNHNWNYVKLGDKWYYLDNTWCVTRNSNRYPESLKSKEFSDKYLLFGTDTAELIGHHIPSYYTKPIEKEDYNREEIKETVKKLSKNFKFTDYPGPVFESRIQR